MIKFFDHNVLKSMTTKGTIVFNFTVSSNTHLAEPQLHQAGSTAGSQLCQLLQCYHGHALRTIGTPSLSCML